MTTKISVYNLDTSITNAISAGGGPKIQTIVYPGNDTAVNTAGGDTVFLNGSGFVTGCTVIVNGAAVPSVTFNSSSNVGFTTSAQSSGGYPIYVVNPDGGTAIAVPGLQYSGVPVWSTAAGSLGSVYETTAFANTVVAIGDVPITYNVATGSLPTGASLNTASGLISGSSVATASPTTYNFTIAATDAQNQDTNRAFSLTVNPDVVTWSSPANNVVYSVTTNSAISNVSLAATSAAGYSVQYSANTLPTGLTLSGNTISGTPTVVGNTNTLVTATANTTTRTAQQIINWVVSVGADTYFPYVATLLSANTSQLPFNDDASTNNFNVTISGDTKPSNWGPYQSGYYSNFFDGTGDYLTLPSATSSLYLTGAFTFETWIYPISTAGTIYGNWNNQTGDAWQFAYNNSGVFSAGFKIYFYRGNYGSNECALGTTTGLNLNTWNHFAVTRDASNNIYIFLNGVSLSLSTYNTVLAWSNSFSFTNSSAIGIGGTPSYSSFNGYMSNLRFVSGSALYTSNFTPSTSPLTAVANTQLLACQSNRIIDNSTNNLTITRSGDTTISSFIPYTPGTSYSTYGSTYFDGNGDYMAVTNNTAFNCGTSDFTLEFWFYDDGTSTSYPSIFSSTDWSTGTGGVSIRYNNTGAANKFFVAFYASNSTPTGGSGVNELMKTTNTYPTKTWHHVAFVRSAGNVFSLYVNGVRDTTTTSSGITIDWGLNGNGPKIGGGNWDGANSYIKGYVSNLRLVKGTALYSGTTYTVPSSPLTAVSNTSLLTCQTNQPVNNNVFVDESSNNFLVTRNGNTTQGTFSPYGSLYSNYFDGSGDYLTIPYNTTAFDWWTTDYTIEAWIYPTSFSGWSYLDGAVTHPTLIGNRVFNTTTDYWSFGINSSGQVMICYFNGSSQVVTSTVTVNLNQWNHIAMTKTSSGIKLFVNGVGNTITAVSGTPQSSSGTSLTIGAGNSNYINGYVSNIRIVKGTAVYTGNFTPPTSPLTAVANTSLLTCNDNRFIDDSPNTFTITRNGDVSVQRFSPFSPQTLPTYYSAYFDGNNDYLTTPSNAAFTLGTGDFTMECWFYRTGANSGSMSLFDIRTAEPSLAPNLYINGSGGSSPLQLEYWVNGASAILAPTAPAANTWHHVAVVRLNGTTKMYLNGTQVGSNYTDTNNYVGTTLTIGGRFAAVTGDYRSWFGYISNARIVKGTAVYTNTFTPSTTPLTAVANTSLLACQSSTFIDNSTNNFTITANGDSRPTTISPFTPTATTGVSYTPAIYGGSMYFDGTGDWINAGAQTAYDFGTGDFTIETFVYGAGSSWTGGDASGFTCICDTRLQSNVAESNRLFIGINNTGSYPYFYDGSTQVSTNSTIPVNVQCWNHIAVTRSSGTVKIWVNGVQGASVSDTTSFTVGRLGIGAGAATAGSTNNRFNLIGYLSDFRWIKGQALYTSNFVPPVSPVLAVKNTSLLLNGTTGGIINSGMIGNLETVGDVKRNTAITKFTGLTSMYFDGTTDYLLMAPSPNTEFGSGDFTIEFWWYPTSTARQGIYHGSFGSDWSIGIDFSSVGTQKIGIWASSNGTSWNLLNADSGGNSIGTTTPTQNAWNHIAYVRNGTTWMLFVNGNRDLNLTGISGSIASRLSNSRAIGSWWSTGSMGQTSGYITDFRITKGYARYTANFTPTTTEFKQS